LKKSKKMTKVKVDEDLCIGCGTCEALCANVFKINDASGKSKVISEECVDCNCQEVVDSCPVNAISMEE
jgi:ferredoxin